MIKRIVGALLPLVSFGLLSFAPFLYLLITRKTGRDRMLFAVFTAASVIEIVLIAVVGRDTTEGTADFLVGVYIVVLAIVAAIIALVELRPGKETAAMPGRAYL
ncbi:hypothetical protein ACIOHC_11200 [Streptomyces sp. NPDC088252]|uniref:hypothetical protein n=1 Tax=unclassified Streptomyces TaxID=2593676 RepID=UPI003817AD96